MWLQFAPVQASSAKHTHALWPAARTLTNPSGSGLLKLLIRGLGLHLREIWPYNTAKHRLTMRTCER